MTKITVKLLIWEEYNSEHIKKHNVSIKEVEEIGKSFLAHKKGQKGRYLIIGRSGSRIISVAISRKGVGVYYPVTARDSSKRERSILYEKEKV